MGRRRGRVTLAAVAEGWHPGLVNRAQRVAMTVALAVCLFALRPALVPFSASGASCGSAVVAAFVDGPSVRAKYLGTREPCPAPARARLVEAAVLLGLVGAFTAGSLRLLRDDRTTAPDA